MKRSDESWVVETYDMYFPVWKDVSEVQRALKRAYVRYQAYQRSLNRKSFIVVRATWFPSQLILFSRTLVKWYYVVRSCKFERVPNTFGYSEITTLVSAMMFQCYFREIDINNSDRVVKPGSSPTDPLLKMSNPYIYIYISNTA